MSSTDKVIIFIAYYFPPYNVIASQRSAKMAINLADKGYKVIVLTLDDHFIPKNKADYVFSKEVFSHQNIKIVKIPIMGIGYEDSANISIWKKIISGFFSRFFLSNGLFWILPLRTKIRELLSNKIGYNFLVSGSPFLSFYIISREKKNNNFINYILDYRDLWSDNPRTPSFFLTRKLIKNTIEKQSIKYSENILTVSNGCAVVLKDFAKKFNKNVYVVRNLPDLNYKLNFNKSYRNLFQNKKKLFVLTGTVYKTCTFSSILNALKKLKIEQLSNIEFHYFGTSSKLVVDEFCLFGFRDLLVDHGYVSKEDAILGLNSASVLISLIDSGEVKYDNSVAGLMTTKVFDYFITNKPILNIGPNKSDIIDFANEIKYKNFFSFEGNNILGIAKFFEEFISNSLCIDYSSNINLPEFDNDFNKIPLFHNLN